MEMTMTYEFITPEMASFLLETNTENRKISRGTVEAYASDILAGGHDEPGRTSLPIYA